MRAALKIIADVARFRLARLEMANLVAAVALMLTLRVAAAEMAGRIVFGLLLNLLVYLNNDFHDRERDLANRARSDEKTAYLASHPGAAIAAQLGLLGLLVAMATLWRSELFAALVLGGGICWAYSARLKRVPGLDVVAMTIWGATMPLVGFPLDLVVGWMLVAQLGLFSTAFESIQVLRDRREDARHGTNTLAVLLGERWMRRVIRGALALAGTYALVCISVPAAAFMAAGMVLPMGDHPSRYWNRIRVLLGLAFVVECATVYFTGQTQGVLWQVPVDARI